MFRSQRPRPVRRPPVRSTRLFLERLESRHLLAGDGSFGALPSAGGDDWMTGTAAEGEAVDAPGMLSVGEVAAKVRGQTITGATIITHGFQFSDDGGDSLVTLAEAVLHRVDAANGSAESAWLLNYSLVVAAEGVVGRFDAAKSVLPSTTGGTGELVLLFDWARESNEPSTGWGEAAGDALFNLVVELGLASPATGTAVPLHWIAHSFGSAVTSEAVERLAAFHIPVDQVTYLDPHDFDQGILPIDGSQRLFELGRPDGYGATVWNNVAFTDVYYQTEFAPDGRPLPGAYNRLVNDQVSGFDAHSDVWNVFYLETVTNTNSTSGYGFSRIGGRARPDLTDAANAAHLYFSQPAAAQNHSHSPASLTNQGQPLSVTDANFTRWSPLWNPLEIVNGDFQDPGDERLPGWIDHGGGRLVVGTCPVECGDAIDGSLALSGRTVRRTHNRLYVPATAKSLIFDVWRTRLSADDQLVVRIDDQVVATIPMDELDSQFTTRQARIPVSFRDGSHTLEWSLVSSLGPVEGGGRLDNVRFSVEGNDPPTEVRLTPSVVRERSSGETIGTLTALDSDSGPNLVFSTSDPRFEVLGATMRLRVGAFVEASIGPLTVEVTATDAGVPPSSTTVQLPVTVQENPWPWQCRENPVDVDRSGFVVPLDVLFIINELNTPTVIGSDWTLPRAKPADWVWHYDVNGDGYCTPLDVVQVINWLNAA